MKEINRPCESRKLGAMLPTTDWSEVSFWGLMQAEAWKRDTQPYMSKDKSSKAENRDSKVSGVPETCEQGRSTG